VRTRRLGRSGLQVSDIGFGAWGIGGGFWQGAEDDRSVAALQAALEAGCTFFDTALAYGNGRSERLIRRALEGWRGAVVLASKVPPQNMQWPARRGLPLADAYPAGHVRACAETSAANLGRPIDLLQLHVWTDTWLDDRAWADLERACDALLAAGTVRWFGVSISEHDTDGAMALLDRWERLAAVQVIYTIWDQRPAERFLPRCAERDIGVIVRVPLDEGGLTGHVTPTTTFPDGDFRAKYFGGDRKQRLAARLARLEPVLRREATTLTEGALRFCLSHPAVTTVIPGMRTVEHARANCAVSDRGPLSPALLDALRAHAWPRNWYLPVGTPEDA
jgi:aryl-alcohol dehydrogenase-like predicted oxidoreductase